MQRTRTAIKAAGRSLAVQHSSRQRAGGRPYAGLPARGPGLYRPVAGFPHAAVRAAGPARPRLRPLGLRAVGAVGSAARYGPLPARRGELYLPGVLRAVGHRAASPGRPQRRRHDRSAVCRPLSRAGRRGGRRGGACLRRGHHVAGIRAAGRLCRDRPRAGSPAITATRPTLFRAWHDRWLAPEFRGWNIEAELPRVTCPVLVLQGADGRVRDAEQVGGDRPRGSGPGHETRDAPGHAATRRISRRPDRSST